MTFVSFALRNLWNRKSRSFGLVAAIAFAVMTVVSLAVTSSGLERSAAAVISIGKADFTVAQKNVGDLLSSTIDREELARLTAIPGVARAVGVLVETERINAANPLFVEIGIAPNDLGAFGVNVVAGVPYAPTAAHELMLGWRAAANFGLHVGSRFLANGTWNSVTGIYSTGNAFGDAGAMLPLPAVQARNRVPGIVTLVFAKVVPGTPVATVTGRVDHDMPELTTIRTATQFGRADRNLIFLQAAVTGTTFLAVVIGAVIVGNTMLLVVFERIREFGLLEAIGWPRRRIVELLYGESLSLAIVGAAIGVGLTFLVTFILERLPALAGVLHTDYTPGAFWRALYTAIGMTVLGALYPALRAAWLTPMKALARE